jgi:hypothetical protein
MDEKAIKFHKDFNGERAKQTTLEAFDLVTLTLGTNVDWIIPLIQKYCGAPDSAHAHALLKMMGHVLILTHGHIAAMDSQQAKDAADKIKEAKQKVS